MITNYQAYSALPWAWHMSALPCGEESVRREAAPIQPALLVISLWSPWKLIPSLLTRLPASVIVKVAYPLVN